MKNHTSYDYKNYITLLDVLHPEHRQVSAITTTTTSATLHQQQHDTNNVQDMEDVMPIETVAVMIDEPSSSSIHQRKRWDAVWAEATLLNSNSNKNNISTSTDTVQQQQQQPGSGPTVIINHTSNVNETAQQQEEKLYIFDAPIYHSNLMECIFGITFTIASVAATLAFEIASIVCYILATKFYDVSQSIQQYSMSSLLGIIFHFIALHFVLLSYLLLFIDYILLIVSIILTETFAISTGILNSIFSLCTNGYQWHQYIRKLCHLTRWAFRDLYPPSKPERTITVFSCCFNSHQQQEEHQEQEQQQNQQHNIHPMIQQEKEQQQRNSPTKNITTTTTKLL